MSIGSRHLLLSALMLLIFSIACDEYCPGAPCPARSIEVTVLDNETGTSVAEGATGVLIDGSFMDSLALHEGTYDVPFVLAYDDRRSGSYTVIVTKDGYEEWRAEGVAITREPCCWSFVQLEARLVRADST